MPLTYAGVDLSPLTPELAAVCDRWWVREAPDLWTFPGYGVKGLDHLPIPAAPHNEAARLGTLVWPTGASRWAVFHQLVGGTQAAAIKTAVDTNNPTKKPLVVQGDSVTNRIAPDMYMLSLRPVFVRGATNTQMWWLTLVDERYYWWLRNLTFSFTAGTTTWAQLLTNLVFAASGLTPSVPAVPASYGLPTARWSDLTGVPLPPLIDAAAASVGLRLVARLDGAVRFVTSTTALTEDAARMTEAESQLAFGGRVPLTDLAGIIPASVNVKAAGGTGAAVPVTLAGLALANYGSINGVTGTAAWVAVDSDTGPSASLATQAATDYYGWLQGRTDATFRTTVPWLPTGMEDRIEWEYMPGRPPLHAEDKPVSELDIRMPYERVTTRIVPWPRADRNVYGREGDGGEPDFNSWRQTGTAPIDVLYPGGNITGDASSFGNNNHTIIVSAVTNTIHALPFVVPHSLTADEIAVWLQCAGRPADVCRLAIYDSESRTSIYPKTRITQTADISIGTATTSLTAPVTAFAGTINVGAVGGFPAVPFFISIDDEVLEVTAVAGLVWTVSRAQKTSTAAAHAAGAAVNYDPKIGSYLTAAISVSLAARKLYWLCVNSDSSDARFGATNDIFMQPIWGFSRTEFCSQYGIKLASAFGAYPATFPSTSGGITYGAFAVTLLHLSG